jgi:hypothetical protein
MAVVPPQRVISRKRPSCWHCTFGIAWVASFHSPELVRRRSSQQSHQPADLDFLVKGLFGLGSIVLRRAEHKVLIVELHHRKDEGRADTEQQHTVGGL